ncbi:hypothetical protein [Sideroxydans lithotrophicus]|uniref:Uncharacterized protein n=1 Tax=Sideroxydans lithotrophicus (strain ES-1) TaxID=580332 RepID=D5CT72_SIDLE|nr:hypothetical protein [Sideroxydans lithotrophicus]ADE12158.1 hypothetical protein Slit_1929 [Sideroxydans lithotrophicus ES-1]
MSESRVLPAYAYRDPQEVAIRNEEEMLRKEKACGQCRERVSMHWYGEELVSCGRKYQQYGRRCEHFRKVFIREEDA